LGGDNSLGQGPTLEEQRAEIMFERGVPPEFANEMEQWALRGRFAAKPPKRTLRRSLLSLLIGLPAIGGTAALFWLLNRIPASEAEKVARATDGLFIGSQVVFGPLLLLVAAAVALCGGYVLTEDPYDSRHRAAQGLWSPLFQPAFYARAIVKRVRPGAVNADDFLLRFRQLDLRIRIGVLAFGALAALVITIGEAGAFYVVGRDGVTQQKFWGETSRKRMPLADVISVDTDCYLTRGRNPEWKLQYKLVMKDGQSFQVGDIPLLRGDRLEALETIAANLPSGVTHNFAIDVRSRIDDCIGTAVANTPNAHDRLIRLLDPDPKKHLGDGPTASSE
jgi:hypothetical protein